MNNKEEGKESEDREKLTHGTKAHTEEGRKEFTKEEIHRISHIFPSPGSRACR